MGSLNDVFGDLAAFSLANEFINTDNLVAQTQNSTSFFNSEYINYIYIGIMILVIIIGFLVYKFKYVKRVQNDNNETSSECFGGICPR
jgi:hypothetical protein